MNGFAQVQPPVEEEEEEVEVGLASPGSRIGAALLNGLFNVLVYVPLLVAAYRVGVYQNTQGLEKLAADDGGLLGWVVGGFLLIAVYGIVQIYYMSRDGQSLGKKIMGIRVLKTDGRNPGFLGTVILRELVYAILLVLVSVGLGMLGLMAGGEAAGSLLSNLVQFGASAACLVMLFQTGKDRRTLQDLLADTVVVKLPKR